MIKREEVFKIGQFNKPHGIHGELSFTFTNDVFDRVECDYFVCLLNGILVPFFVEEYRFRSGTTALVKLEDVDSAEKARMFTNVEVYFPAKYMDKEAEDAGLAWEFFEGFEVHDVKLGYLGKIVEIDQSTINVLFVVEHKGEQLLIPAQEELMVEVDAENRRVEMNLPEGLCALDDLPDDD